jgi:myo-inositol-1(or 4)-monophosphatase
MADRPSFNFVPQMGEIARQAGALLMDYFVRRVKVEYKGDVDLVTEADRNSEKFILSKVRAIWPTHDIMAEEGGKVVDKGSDYRWYIDPLDGTTNFAHGFPVFCVSLAIDYRGHRIAGVVFDPTRNELFAAEQGKGAYLNGEAIHVSSVNNLGECLLATGFPSQKRHKNPNIHFYHQITLKSHGLRRAGSAALDLCCVAAGRFDGFWEFNLNPWDTAAGVLIVEEAGGKVSNFYGGPFQIESKETVASNAIIHQALLAEFKAIFEGRGLDPLPDPREYAKTRIQG